MYPNRGDMEHRWGHRRDINRTVQLETRGGVASRGRLTNVSISGAFVKTALPAPLFSHIRLQFTGMVHDKRTPISLEGQVVRKDEGGFGVEWSEFAAEAVKALVLVPPYRQTEPAGPHASAAPHSEWEPEAHPERRRVRAHNAH